LRGKKGLFSASLLNANNRIHIGIIGTGSRGTGLAPIIDQIQNVQLTAVCDVLPFRLESCLSNLKAKVTGYMRIIRSFWRIKILMLL
jgi:predicted dehydrogenase